MGHFFIAMLNNQRASEGILNVVLRSRLRDFARTIGLAGQWCAGGALDVIKKKRLSILKNKRCFAISKRDVICYFGFWEFPVCVQRRAAPIPDILGWSVPRQSHTLHIQLTINGPKCIQIFIYIYIYIYILYKCNHMCMHIYIITFI